MRKALLVIVFTTFCFSATSQTATEITSTRNAAIGIAIEDFLKSRLIKSSNAFYVGGGYEHKKGEYEPYEVSSDLLVVGIGPTETTDSLVLFDDYLGRDITFHELFITLSDTLGSSRLPTRYIVQNGKLFYWSDSDYGLTEETIKVFLDYNVADILPAVPPEYWGYHSDFVKGAVYYFCKNNLSKYKRVITSGATGWYKPPRVRCTRRK